MVMRWIPVLAAVALLAVPLPGKVRRLTTGINRPLKQAIDLLAERHGWRISYEEAPLRYSGDIFGHGPKLGVLSLTYDPGEGPEAVLRQLLAEHEQRDGVGRFEVARLGRRWLVTVKQMRDENGRWAEARSPLETRIGFDRRGWYANGLGEIWWQLREKAGVAVGVGGLARGRSPMLLPSAGKQPGLLMAREVIASMKQLGLRGELAEYDADWYLICAGKRFGCTFDYVRGKPLIAPPPPPPGSFLPPLPNLPRPAPATR